MSSTGIKRRTKRFQLENSDRLIDKFNKEQTKDSTLNNYYNQGINEYNKTNSKSSE